MAVPTAPEGAGTSTRPYLIRALHEWCRDNGYTPYIAVHVDSSVRVPSEYVKNREIVLNVGFEATNGLVIGNDRIEFKARFAGVPREIMVPISHVIAIYARENGQGMAFPAPTAEAVTAAPTSSSSAGEPEAGRTAGAPAAHLVLAQSPALAPTTDAPKEAASPAAVPPAAPADPAAPPDPSDPGSPSGRPTLKRIK